MSKIRICFLGTPEFAVHSLRGLLQDEHFEIVGVVTQPDRPAGRKLQLSPSPIKSLALAKGLRVISPERVNDELILQEIQKWRAEVAVVVAFGQILSTKFLNLFPFGAVNVHGSILPRWRGAAPIQRALEAGDVESGVTLQKIVKELDAGDIIAVRRVPLNQDINALELHDQLALLGADLLHVELMDYLRGNLAPVPQNSEGITYTKKIQKIECGINWSESAVRIHNKVRGFLLGPGCSAQFQGKRLKIFQTQFVDIKSRSLPGTIIHINDNSFVVQTGNESALALLEVQPESRNRMKAAEFIHGYDLKKGDRLENL